MPSIRRARKEKAENGKNHTHYDKGRRRARRICGDAGHRRRGCAHPSDDADGHGRARRSCADMCFDDELAAGREGRYSEHFGSAATSGRRDCGHRRLEGERARLHPESRCRSAAAAGRQAGCRRRGGKGAGARAALGRRGRTLLRRQRDRLGRNRRGCGGLLCRQRGRPPPFAQPACWSTATGAACAAGGALIQLLPGASDETAALLERNAAAAPAISSIYNGGTPEEAAAIYLAGIEYDLFDSIECGYVCPCNRSRTTRALLTLGKDELEDMYRSPEETTLSCQFCGRSYAYSKEEIKALAEKAARMARA